MTQSANIYRVGIACNRLHLDHTVAREDLLERESQMQSAGADGEKGLNRLNKEEVKQAPCISFLFELSRFAAKILSW